MNETRMRSTTVIAVKHKGEIAIGADGQATLGATIAKSNVKKIRKLREGTILTGFAGSTADAFTLLDRFEEKLNSYSGNMKRSAVELAKDWRMDRYLRRLEAMIIVANKEEILIISGTGDVLEPDNDIEAPVRWRTAAFQSTIPREQRSVNPHTGFIDGYCSRDLSPRARASFSRQHHR